MLPVGEVPDSLAAWMVRYLTLAVVGVRSDNVARKIALHLHRFASFYREAYGHERISTCLRRDVLAWQRELISQGLAPVTVTITWPRCQASPPGSMPRRRGCFRSVIRQGDRRTGAATVGATNPQSGADSVVEESVRSTGAAFTRSGAGVGSKQG